MPKYTIEIDWNEPIPLDQTDLGQEIAWAIQERFDSEGYDVTSVSVTTLEDN